MDKYTKKILDNDDKFIVFYSDWCGYSMTAINLLKEKNLKFKKYKIDKINGKLQKLLECFIKTKTITKFDCSHNTRPIIFHKGIYIGGHTNLVSYIQNDCKKK